MEQLKRIIYRLAKLYPVGPKNLSEGIAVCRALHEFGAFSTLGKFNNKGEDPKQIVQECQTASDALKSASAGERFYLSLKPPRI